MLAGAPGAACSKEFSSGSISSHPARYPCTFGAFWLKSGTRNGLASCACTTDCGSAVRSRTTFEKRLLGLRLLLDLEPGLPLHLALEPPRRVRDLGVLLQQREQRRLTRGDLGEDRGQTLEPLELRVALGRRERRVVADVGPLGACQQGRGLEPRALTGGQLPSRDGALDLAYRHREHRDDALVVAVPDAVPGSLTRPGAPGPASTLCGQPAALFLKRESLPLAGRCPPRGVPPFPGGV